VIFIDSNVPMYAAGREHPNRQPALDFLARAQSGEVEVCTSTAVLQEILYRYHALSRLDLALQVYDLFVALCPTVLPVTLADTDLARRLIEDVAGLGVRDAIHAAVSLNHDVETVASFDRTFDRVPNLTRLAPH
jgi:hypothetical protein